MYLGRSVTVGGFGTGATRSTRSTRSRRGTPSPGPDKLLDDEAARQIAETRQYLDDAEELLRTETTAVGFINAKVARDPDHLGRYVPWAGTAGTRALYETREAAARGHPPPARRHGATRTTCAVR
jgi:hypothetical protein